MLKTKYPAKGYLVLKRLCRAGFLLIAKYQKYAKNRIEI